MKKTTLHAILGLILFLTSFIAYSETLTVWVRTDTMLKVFNSYNEKMKAEGKDIQVKVNVLTDGFPAAFSAAMSSGDEVDLVSIDLVLVPYYSRIGVLQDITELYNSLPYKNQLNKAMMTLSKYDGKIYALPNSADVSALAYNKDLFRKAGLDPNIPPTNWAEFDQMCEKIKASGTLCYAFSGGDAGGMMFTMMPWVWANGGSWLSSDGLEAQLDSPQTAETFSWFYNLIKKGYTPKAVVNYSWNDFRMAFLQQKVAIAGIGSFWLESTKKADIDFGVIPFFSKDGKTQSAFVGGDLLAIPKTAKHKKAVIELLHYIHSEAVQVEIYAKNGQIPVIQSYLDNKYFKMEPRYNAFAQAAQTGFVPYTTKYNELYAPFLKAAQGAIMGYEVNKTLKDGAKKMQRVIDRPR